MESHLLRMLSVPLSGLSSSTNGAATARTAQQQQQQQQPQPPEPSLVVFSGGTAFNSVAGHMRQLTTRIAHVLPVSDDGGSTAEIVRVLGGPAVGDIRSRCLRLAGGFGLGWVGGAWVGCFGSRGRWQGLQAGRTAAPSTAAAHPPRVASFTIVAQTTVMRRRGRCAACWPTG